MHKLMAGGTILEHELSDLRLLVERQAGILLDCPNSALAAHVAEYLEIQELGSVTAVIDRLRSADQDPACLPHFLSGVVNTDTGFFRHPGAMNALTRQVLPQLFARKSADNPATLRMWSAGCSTGEETYSIAMAACAALAGNSSGNSVGNAGGTCAGSAGGNNFTNPATPSYGNGSPNGSSGGKNTAGRNGGISEAFSSAPGTMSTSPAGTPQPLKEFSIHIVGSDLLPCSIEVAERGLYPQSALAGLPPATIRACFSKIGSPNGNGSANLPNPSSPAPQNGSANGSHLLVKPRLRSLVTFNTMNLTKPVYIGRFDCIFCMDVLPHLSRVQRTSLLERLHLYLEPGGYLFLSQTEKLSAPNLNFRSETFDGYTFHRKPLAASAAYGR
ncbi:MAG TPA: CheR family methyltransferase [Candidatus Sulfotelmatobacter sp.]|nr:CheR family methyltransferase [Candidatus Sulfotelmatobacter sp.]